MNRCFKCGKETKNNPIPKKNKNGFFTIKGSKDRIRCNDCIKKGLKNILNNIFAGGKNG